MPAVLLDLDNTLVDRRGAFASWAREFVESAGRASTDFDWLIEADRDGEAPWPELASAIKIRFDLSETPESIAEMGKAGVVEHIRTYPGVRDELAALQERGFALVVVTNGTTHQQTRKLDATDLWALLDGVVISEGLGIRKPEPRIFHHALNSVGAAIEGSWMVGDHPENDIRGAARLGLKTSWVGFGAAWHGSPAPTAVSFHPREAIAAVTA